MLLVIGKEATAGKVIIRLGRPPPDKLGVADMWNLEINNTSGNEVRLYLKGTATEEKDGLIIEGTSKVFTVKPGKTNYKYSDFSNAEVKYNNGKYKEVILRTGNAPEGNYTICVTAFSESGEVLGQENCIEQTVKQQGNISLISPSDGEEVDASKPVIFSWTPLPKGGPSSLIIVEIKGEQSLDIAMKSSADAVVAESNIISNYQLSPSELKKLETGKKYAWQISNGDMKSEIYTFEIAGSDTALTGDYKYPCTRHDVSDYVSATTELTKIFLCGRAFSSCDAYDQIENLTYGYDAGWLWIGNSGHTFTIAEQNTLFNQAKQWAMDHRTNCSNGAIKTIISITFFHDMVVGEFNSGYFIGCKVKYGCCSSWIQHGPYQKK